MKKSMTSPKEAAVYVAFLRGINVGGNKIVKMADVKKAFEALKFRDVKTVLASGNVIFTAGKEKPEALKKQIEEKLAKTFGHEIRVILRSIEELQALAEAEPFAKIKVTPQTRLYVTFFADKPASHLRLPKEVVAQGFTIVRQTDHELGSVFTVSDGRGTVDLMGLIEKHYGRGVTTRNWNTIAKLLK